MEFRAKTGETDRCPRFSSMPRLVGSCHPRAGITAGYRVLEPQTLAPLLARARLSATDAATVQASAADLASGVRESRTSTGYVNALMQGLDTARSFFRNARQAANARWLRG